MSLHFASIRKDGENPWNFSFVSASAATTAIKPTAAIAVTRAESCSLDHFDMLAETAGLIKGELHWSPSGSFQRPKPVQCTLMSLLINLKASHANGGMQRSRTIPLESFGQHSMARARTVCTVASHDRVKQPAKTAGRINDKFPWNISGSSRWPEPDM
jgi:hypothetical protein